MKITVQHHLLPIIEGIIKDKRQVFDKDMEKTENTLLKRMYIIDSLKKTLW